jgi:hypothetical protein
MDGGYDLRKWMFEDVCIGCESTVRGGNNGGFILNTELWLRGLGE